MEGTVLDRFVITAKHAPTETAVFLIDGHYVNMEDASLMQVALSRADVSAILEDLEGDESFAALEVHTLVIGPALSEEQIMSVIHEPPIAQG